jgi:asparagine synthase (glutamine-hydrolysing)
MMAANSVEGRFPFLDHRVVEFSTRLPPGLKIRGLREKHILKESARGFLPESIVERHKQPYRAPIHAALLASRNGAATQPMGSDYVADLLSAESLCANGVLSPEPVARLIRKWEVRGHLSEFEDMALVAVLSTQLLYRQFIGDFHWSTGPADRVRVCRGEEPAL